MPGQLIECKVRIAGLSNRTARTLSIERYRLCSFDRITLDSDTGLAGGYCQVCGLACLQRQGCVKGNAREACFIAGSACGTQQLLIIYAYDFVVHGCCVMQSQHCLLPGGYIRTTVNQILLAASAYLQAVAVMQALRQLYVTEDIAAFFPYTADPADRYTGSGWTHGIDDRCVTVTEGISAEEPTGKNAGK